MHAALPSPIHLPSLILIFSHDHDHTATSRTSFSRNSSSSESESSSLTVTLLTSSIQLSVSDDKVYNELSRSTSSSTTITEDNMAEDNFSYDYQDDPMERMRFMGVVWVTLKYLIADVVVYGGLFPVIGTYFANCCAKVLKLSANWEVALATISTFSLLYLSFWLVFVERPFWKHFLAFDAFYRKLLKLRDLLNSFTIIACMIAVHQTVVQMSSANMSRNRNLGDGVGYVFLTMLIRCSPYPLDPDVVLQSLKPSVVYGFSEKENSEYELNAEYMFYWTVLAASIAKLVYFNALLTKLRAMEIFTSMKPLFMDYDGYDDSMFGKDYKSVNFAKFERPVHKPNRNAQSNETLLREAQFNEYSYIS